jgi:hypothetical protein
LSYWLITESGKVISKTSIEHVICDDYLQADTKLHIATFDAELTASLDDVNFIRNGEGEFDSLYLQDIDDDLHSGIRCAEDETTPTPADYGDMHTDDRPDDDDESAVDNHLNVELIMNMGTNEPKLTVKATSSSFYKRSQATRQTTALSQRRQGQYEA